MPEEEHKPSGAELDRAAAQAQRQDRASPIVELAFDVLSRQGEGRQLFAGKEFVAARAKEHRVAQDAAATPLGNVMTILERGPDSGAERALVAALAIRALGERFTQTDPAARQELLDRFVRHADWLEIATPFSIYALVDRVLDEPAASAIWTTVEHAVVADAALDATAPIRARAAARLGALAASERARARGALERVTAAAGDGAVRAMARALGGAVDFVPAAAVPGGASSDARVHGSLGRAPSTPVRGALRLVSGVALLSWLARGVAFIAGLRREAEIELVEGAVRVRRRTSVLGKTVRESTETYTLAALSGAGRQVRYPSLHLLVGAMSLGAGILIGGIFAYDGLRTGEISLLAIAALVLLAGAALDLALDVLVPARRGCVYFDLRVLPKRTIRLRGVRLEEADSFLSVLAKKIAS